MADAFVVYLMVFYYMHQVLTHVIVPVVFLHKGILFKRTIGAAESLHFRLCARE